jgi:hypothetical protein
MADARSGRKAVVHAGAELVPAVPSEARVSIHHARAKLANRSTKPLCATAACDPVSSRPRRSRRDRFTAVRWVLGTARFRAARRARSARLRLALAASPCHRPRLSPRVSATRPRRSPRPGCRVSEAVQWHPVGARRSRRPAGVAAGPPRRPPDASEPLAARAERRRSSVTLSYSVAGDRHVDDGTPAVGLSPAAPGRNGVPPLPAGNRHGRFRTRHTITLLNSASPRSSREPDGRA